GGKMTQLPNLKFDKNRKFLTEQLEIQKAKVNNITDIISNIKSISQSKTCNVYYLNDLLDTGNGLITEINANIVSIEALFTCLEEITIALSTILSPENQKGKTKSYYIDSFTKLERVVTDYSRNFNKIMKKLENDNTTYDTFIASCNLNSSSDSFSSNPDQIRQILEKNLVEQDNTFASIADSYKVENHEISLEATDDIPQIEPAMQVDTSVNAPAIESFIDENMELPDIKIKDEDYTDSDTAEDTNSIESISLSDDLQEIIDDVSNSNDTEIETINAISMGFEGLINASTSYTINALKKSNRDFYDSLRNLSFEYDDFSTPISQLEKKSKTVPTVSSNYQVKDIDTTKNEEVTPNEIKVEIKERPKTEKKSIQDNVISNRVISNITNEETPEVETNAINNSTDTITLDTSDIRKFTNVLNTPNNSTDLNDEGIDQDMDSSSIIDNEDDNKADEESLFNIQDELISNLDEVESLADALNSSDNITITMQDKDSDEEAVVKGSTDNTVAPRTISLSKDKIEKIIKAEADNETLIISEKNNKIYLPYKMSEIKNYMHSYPDAYNDASDVVKQEFILDLSEFMQHPSKTRFQETYTLIRNRDGKSVASAVLYGLKLVKKSNLSPAVIAACKHKDELDRYLNCLKENKLDEFKSFNIMYEINPHKI
nr:hypothetical protein [Clostridia bacterium]